MAYAFLKALGVDGNIGTFTLDLDQNKINTSQGHELVSAKNQEFEIKSSRYPFCACEPVGQAVAAYPACANDDNTKDNSIHSALTLIPFNQELNRLVLVTKNGRPVPYKVTWGGQSKTFTREQLAAGINLAEEFPTNPFSEAFAKVDAAVAAKQAYETKQIKQLFHGPEGKADMEGVVSKTENEREPLAKAIKLAFAPVTHVLKVEPQ
jgi:hypothetical protein